MTATPDRFPQGKSLLRRWSVERNEGTLVVNTWSSIDQKLLCALACSILLVPAVLLWGLMEGSSTRTIRELVSTACSWIVLGHGRWGPVDERHRLPARDRARRIPSISRRGSTPLARILLTVVSLTGTGIRRVSCPRRCGSALRRRRDGIDLARTSARSPDSARLRVRARHRGPASERGRCSRGRRRG